MTQDTIEALKNLAHELGATGRYFEGASLEALLAEREELLKDKARLDHYEKHSRNYRFIDGASMDGKYPAWSYWSPSEGRNDKTLRKTLREAIDAAMKGGLS